MGKLRLGIVVVVVVGGGPGAGWSGADEAGASFDTGAGDNDCGVLVLVLGGVCLDGVLSVGVLCLAVLDFGEG